MKTTGAFLLLCLALAGCASEGYQSLTVAGQARQAADKIDSRLKQVKIGMTRDQVVALLGKPTKINTTITAGGRREQWIYSEHTLAENLLGYMQRSSYEFETRPQYTSAGTQVWGKSGESYWYLYFDDSVLTAMQEEQ